MRESISKQWSERHSEQLRIWAGLIEERAESVQKEELAKERVESVKK